MKPNNINNFVKEFNKEYDTQLNKYYNININKTIEIPYLNHINSKINKPKITDYTIDIKEVKTLLYFQTLKKFQKYQILIQHLELIQKKIQIIQNIILLKFKKLI